MNDKIFVSTVFHNYSSSKGFSCQCCRQIKYPFRVYYDGSRVHTISRAVNKHSEYTLFLNGFQTVRVNYNDKLEVENIQ